MEAAGNRKQAEWMATLPPELIPEWLCSDRDTSSQNIYTAALSRLRYVNDPGHMKKNIVKTVQKIVGQSQFYKSFPMRFGNLWLRVQIQSRLEAKSLAEIEPLMLKYLGTWWSHFFNEQCPADCFCKTWAGHEGVRMYIQCC